jgi:glycosyltransferase involved in cell wall biosynthesis
MNFICKVFSLVCNNFQNFQIKILNQFENKNSLEELVRHYKLENYVIINEDVSEFEKFIDDLDFYLTAPYENVNTKEINNVALKKIPVIVPNLEFLNEIIVHGLNGFFYEKADLNSFIMLVEKILQYTTYHSDKICKDFINVNHLNYLKKVYHILEELTLHDFEVL